MRRDEHSTSEEDGAEEVPSRQEHTQRLVVRVEPERRDPARSHEAGPARPFAQTRRVIDVQGYDAGPADLPRPIPPSEPTMVGATAVPETVDAKVENAAPLARAEAPLGVRKQHALFREQAINSYLSSMRESEVLRVAPPWARRVLVTASLLVVLGLAATFLVKVDQTGHGRGVLRVAGGAQAVASQTTGVVLELAARSGEVVPAGALLAKIDSTATKTSLLQTEQEIARAEEDVKTFRARRDKEQAARISLLNQRAALLQKRLHNQAGSVTRLRDRLATFDRLVAEGLASSLDKAAAENDLAAGQRSALQLEEEISATRLQISNINADLAQELDRKQAELRAAKDRRDALAFQLEQTEVRAPKRGRLEALVVKVGDSVALGTPIARLIPEGAPRQVIVFLPEADRAFLQDGAAVHIELDQLPVGEFGSLQGRVTRISSDLATPAEITEAFGDTKLDGPTFLVEVQIEDSAAVQKLDALLRPGSRVTGRFVLRTRRLATLLFEPLKSFLD